MFKINLLESDNKTCTICKESCDSQFISKFETLNPAKKVIHVCEYCNDDIGDYDHKQDLPCIEHNNLTYYPSYLL